MQSKKLFLLLITVFAVSTNSFSQKVTIGNISKPVAIEQTANHYASLNKSSSKPNYSQIYSDSVQFDLTKMSPRYYNNLKLRAVYIDVPLNTFIIGDFPANSSLQTQKEIEYLKALADTSRTQEKMDECYFFADVYYRNLVVKSDTDYVAMRKNLFHMGRQLGEWFNPDSLPNTANLMANVWQDASYYIWALKFKYNRIRPYNLDKELKNISDPNFPAYPSGHSSSSYVAAFVYSELLPDYKTLFTDNAYAMAFSREILGVHFPSDSEAGRKFARQFVNLLLQSSNFKKDLLLAKKEIEKVKKTKKIPLEFKDKKPCKVPISNCDPSKCSS